MAGFVNGLLIVVGLSLVLMFSIAQSTQVGVWRMSEMGGEIPVPREGMACEFYGNSIFVHGGRGGMKTWYKSMHVFELDSLKWRNLPAEDKGIDPRSGHSMTSVNDKFYIFGGRTNFWAWSKEMITFDPATDWFKVLETRGTGPSPRQSHSAVAINNKIFIYGGFDGTNRFADLHVFDTDRNEWTQPQTNGTKPGELEGHKAVVVGTKMYLFGGYTGRNYVSDVFVLDTETMNWTVANSEGKPRVYYSANRIGSYIYVFGGNIRKTLLNDVKVFDIDTHKWIESTISGNTIPPRQGHCAVLAYRTQLFVFGGSSSWTSYFNDLWILDTSINAKRTTAISSVKDTDGKAAQIELTNKVDVTLDKANLLLKTDSTDSTDDETEKGLSADTKIDTDGEGIGSDPLLGIEGKIELWSQIGVLYRSLNQDQKGSLKNFSIEISNLMNATDRVQKERLDLKIQMQKQVDDLHNLRQQFRQAEENATDLANQKASATAMHTQLSERIVEAQNVLDDLKSQQRQRRILADRAENSRSDLDKRHKSLKSHCDRTFQLRDEAKQRRMETDSKLKNLRERLANLTDEETLLVNQENELTQSITDLQRRLSRLKELKNEVEGLKRKYETSRKIFEEYRNTKAVIVGKIKEEVPTSSKTATSSSLQVPTDDFFDDDELTQNIKQMENTLAEKQESLSKIEGNNKNFQQLRSKLKDQEAVLVSELNSAIDDAKRFEKDWDSKVQEINGVEAQLRTAAANAEWETQQLNQLTEQIPIKTKQINEIRAELADNEKKIAEIQNKESAARNELEMLQLSLSTKHEDLLSTVNRFTEKSTSLASIRRSIASTKKSRDSQLASTIQSRKQLHDLVLRAESEWRTKVADLEDQVAKLRAQLGQ